MLEFLTAEIAFVASIITVIGLIWGPKAWPAFYSWLGRIWKAASYPIRGTERRVDELKATQENLVTIVSNISNKLDILATEFSPNGGSSLKDSLNRIELKQAANENATNFIISSLDIPMFKTDSEGTCIWASTAYCNLSGMNLEELLGWGWLSAIHPEDLEGVRSQWLVCVSEKRLFESRFKVRHSYGTEVTVYSKAVPTFFNNKLSGWVGSWEVIDGS
jgi:PAS domain S-box-containing protein